MKNLKSTFCNILICAAAFATQINAEVTIPHVFQANTPAIADEVNANFDAVKLGIEESLGVQAAATPNSSFQLSTADRIVRTLTTTPSRDGMVLFTFQAWFTCTSAAACVARCSVNPGGATLDTSRFAISSVASGQYQTMSVSGALPVSANNMLTLNAVCDVFTGVGSLGDPALTSIFSANQF
ncbi:MAG: hypothetical protein AAF353_16165 [Pseudomonadota bacterium]